MEPGRLYLWALSVCSDSHRILMGAGARVAAMRPSRRRWERSKCASVRGTRAKRGSRHRSREKKFLPHPLALTYSMHCIVCIATIQVCGGNGDRKIDQNLRSKRRYWSKTHSCKILSPPRHTVDYSAYLDVCGRVRTLNSDCRLKCRTVNHTRRHTLWAHAHGTRLRDTGSHNNQYWAYVTVFACTSGSSKIWAAEDRLRGKNKR